MDNGDLKREEIVDDRGCRSLPIHLLEIFLIFLGFVNIYNLSIPISRFCILIIVIFDRYDIAIHPWIYVGYNSIQVKNIIVYNFKKFIIGY